jgi:hypothetical protein
MEKKQKYGVGERTLDFREAAEDARHEMKMLRGTTEITVPRSLLISSISARGEDRGPCPAKVRAFRYNKRAHWAQHRRLRGQKPPEQVPGGGDARRRAQSS